RQSAYAIEILIQPGDLRAEDLCLARRDQPAFDALEQLESQLHLCVREQFARCRLRNMQRRGRLGQRTGAAYSLENLDVSKAHGKRGSENAPFYCDNVCEGACGPAFVTRCGSSAMLYQNAPRRLPRIENDTPAANMSWGDLDVDKKKYPGGMRRRLVERCRGA